MSAVNEIGDEGASALFRAIQVHTAPTRVRLQGTRHRHPLLSHMLIPAFVFVIPIGNNIGNVGAFPAVEAIASNCVALTALDLGMCTFVSC